MVQGARAVDSQRELRNSEVKDVVDSYFDGVMNHRRESPAGFIRGDHVLGGGCRGARRPRS